MRLDIIIPAHNEEHRIDGMLRAFRSRIDDPGVRFVVALDRCTDGTAEVVERHAKVDARVRMFSYPKLGKGGVILETLRRCNGDVIGFVDADCATPPMEFLRLAEAVGEGADVAIATRWHNTAVVPGRRPMARRLESRIFAQVIRTLFGLPYRDTQCGAKVLSREVAQAVVPFLSSRDFLFDVEMLLSARSLGYEVLEIPTVWVDRAGSRLHAGRDGRRMALSALRLWLHVHVVPLPSAADGRLEPASPCPDVLDEPVTIDLTEPVMSRW